MFHPPRVRPWESSTPPSSLFFQNGPPGWTRKTWRSLSTKRYMRRPAARPAPYGSMDEIVAKTRLSHHQRASLLRPDLHQAHFINAITDTMTACARQWVIIADVPETIVGADEWTCRWQAPGWLAISDAQRESSRKAPPDPPGSNCAKWNIPTRHTKSPGRLGDY